jgi:hypothetical protein
MTLIGWFNTPQVIAVCVRKAWIAVSKGFIFASSPDLLVMELRSQTLDRSDDEFIDIRPLQRVVTARASHSQTLAVNAASLLEKARGGRRELRQRLTV